MSHASNLTSRLWILWSCGGYLFAVQLGLYVKLAKPLQQKERRPCCGKRKAVTEAPILIHEYILLFLDIYLCTFGLGPCSAGSNA